MELECDESEYTRSTQNYSTHSPKIKTRVFFLNNFEMSLMIS